MPLLARSGVDYVEINSEVANERCPRGQCLDNEFAAYTTRTGDSGPSCVSWRVIVILHRYMD